MGHRVLDVAAATADRDGLGCCKLVVFCNIPEDVPFMAGGYLGVGEADARDQRRCFRSGRCEKSN